MKEFFKVWFYALKIGNGHAFAILTSMLAFWASLFALVLVLIKASTT